MALADLLAHRHDDALPAHHGAQAQRDGHGHLHPQRDEFGGVVHLLLEGLQVDIGLAVELRARMKDTSFAMPAPVSPLAHALRLLKVELAQTRLVRAGAKATTETQKRIAQPEAGQGYKSTALRRLPAKLRAAREKSDGLHHGKALRLFVEAVLVDELGSDLQLDAAFGDLVERTCRAVEQDESSANLLKDALKELEDLAD